MEEKYVIRRCGLLVGVHTDFEEAKKHALKGDTILIQHESTGPLGCVHEHILFIK